MLASILCVCGLLAVGLLLRVNVHLLRVLFIPASVVAGVIGFAVVQIWRHYAPEQIAPIASELSTWPSTLIAVVFAALLLEGDDSAGFTQAIKRGSRSGICAWIIILGQIVIGLCVFQWMILPGHPNVPATFGQLLEVSWAGGHGASTAMGNLYAAAGFVEGRDLGLFLATVGLIYGVISGLVIVNIAIRRGWTAGGATAKRIEHVSGLEPSHNPLPTAYARTRSEVMEPMTLQLLILAASFAGGLGMSKLLTTIVYQFTTDADTRKAFDNLPLFLFTLLSGLCVRKILVALSLGRLIDQASLKRITGVAMEFLIVAAVSTMRIESLTTYLLPIIVLVSAAAVWSAFTLMWLSRKLLPKAYWFELGLLNYGFSTANTPQGFMLLRIVDPELKTRAAEDYAIAAPLSAPFVGGGIVTFVGFPWLFNHIGVVPIIVLALVTMVALYFVGRSLSRD